MSRSIVLLSIAAFTLSAPIHARTLATAGAVEQLAPTTSGPLEIAPPECTKEKAGNAAVSESAGGMPDTGAATAEAQVTACCWFYMYGRWWCVQCS
jgi:hypothetical protein